MVVITSLLTAAAGGAVSKVTELASNQLSLDIVFCLGKERYKLKDCSKLIGDIIHDTALDPADPRLQAKAEWMKRLISVACKAEDVIDEFQYEVYRIAIKEPSLDKKILGFFSCNNPLLFRFRMAPKINNINKTLNDLHNGAASVGLIRSSGAAGASQGIQAGRETTSLPEPNEVTLKDAIIVPRTEVADIIASLSNPNNQEKILLVMAIVGMGGLGKTTLARSVTKELEEGEMKRYFDIKLWVYVSVTFDVNSILRRMLESCEADKSDDSSREGLMKSLRQKLEGKKYFLVLDDVWNEEANEWNDLKSCLLQLKSAKGSTVIITTRNASVASIMGVEADHCCDLKGLSINECWLIMKDRAFADPNDPRASDFEEIGKKLAEKCAGLALAAKVLGSMLHSKTRKAEWESILGNEIWQSSSDNVDNMITTVLKLSFDNLQPPLKRCFAYCSMLERGSLIQRDELIQLWMAQGLLFSCPGQIMEREMEDIGDEYFDTLLKNSLFQDATMDEDGFITECGMHDLVYALAIKVSSSLQDSWTPDFEEEIDHSPLIRHVARVPTPDLKRLPKKSIPRLRSLFSNVEDSNIISPKLRALRVLRLYEYSGDELRNDRILRSDWPPQLPFSLDKLRHLRYLSFATITGLSVSIGNLYNLQTLRLPYLDYCPKEIQNLINLRHLHADERMAFKAGLGRLTELRTLTSFNVGKVRGPSIEELGALKHLRGNLIISALEHVRDREQAESAHLVQKTHLRQLTFRWTYIYSAVNAPPNENHTDVLDGLEPHSELRRLRIENFMGARFPSWISSTSLGNLSEIKLFDCNNCQKLPQLGHLTGLKSLLIFKMKNLERIGAEFYGTSTTSFPALRTLKISECEKVIEWIEAPRMTSSGEEVVVFPCLEELHLDVCHNLESAPSRFPCLKKLSIYKMGNSMAIENISTQLTTLADLSICNVEGLTCLPEGMLQKNKNLTSLQISACDELTCIAPDVSGCCASLRSLIISECVHLTCLPDGLHTLPCLDMLQISGCAWLKSIWIPHGIASLRELLLYSCEGLSSLEFGLDCCPALEKLVISHCRDLVSIPIPQGVPSLSTLIIHDCSKISNLGSGLNHCPSLEELVISGCDDLISIPITEGIASLQRLSIVSYHSLLSLPSGLQYCTSLERLEIRECSSLVSLSGLLFLTCLKELRIGKFCEELDAFPDFQLPPNSQLEDLSLEGWPMLKSLPQQIQHYTCLKNLRIYDFEGLEALPDWLGNLTSLERLDIGHCNKLKYLPKLDAMESLTKLKELSIVSCPLLKERCTKQNGALEWPKISHVPYIRVYN